MRSRVEGSSGLVSHGSPHERDLAITAVELARMAGVTPADIHYWGKSEYLKRMKNGSSPYPATQIPKAQLMGIFAKQLHMDAASSSRLAEQLLPVYAAHPNVVEALETLAEVVEQRIEGLARLLMETDLVAQLAKLLEREDGKSEKP